MCSKYIQGICTSFPLDLECSKFPVSCWVLEQILPSQRSLACLAFELLTPLFLIKYVLAYLPAPSRVSRRQRLSSVLAHMIEDLPTAFSSHVYSLLDSVRATPSIICWWQCPMELAKSLSLTEISFQKNPEDIYYISFLRIIFWPGALTGLEDCKSGSHIHHAVRRENSRVHQIQTWTVPRQSDFLVSPHVLKGWCGKRLPCFILFLFWDYKVMTLFLPSLLLLPIPSTYVSLLAFKFICWILVVKLWFNHESECPDTKVLVPTSLLVDQLRCQWPVASGTLKSSEGRIAMTRWRRMRHRIGRK